MVKTKHKKSKPSPSRVKKHGNKSDLREMQAQLDALGLKIIEVTADGNCFFRKMILYIPLRGALADQLDGKEEEHDKYRSMIVRFILNNRDMFEPFIEDEEPFDDYCQSMQSDGTWAGHMELQAASLVTQCNICIHRHMSPRWYILNFGKHEARMIHLSYHGGEHYNSVRSKDDACIGPAKPITIKADADISATSQQGKPVSVISKANGRNIIQQGSIQVVVAGSGCEDVEQVKKVLEQVGGDVDAAIEYLIEERGSVEALVGNDIFPSSSDSRSVKAGDGHEKNSEQPEIDAETEKVDHKASNKDEKISQEKRSLLHEEKKISRNKACPCGSKKKNKSCCGSVAGKSSISRITGTIDSGNGKNDRKQSKKGGAANALKHGQSDKDALNLGALCI